MLSRRKRCRKINHHKNLAGFYKPDQGEISIDDESVSFSNPRDSKNHGISVIHQELLLVPHLTVAENISLGHWPQNNSKMINWKDVYNRAKEALDKLGEH
ncbi:ATP-binding cassette domain-containing protein [Neobacillus pocheonensis]|uniref:ATP-binding cassette domain-containing protein n=1 Tax=Neobacillus pocheonensis TaxID=363869 RepID=A0ABT0WAH6_9BACI|nr:ATP-binding cassette domain-containing protein [Neobacillus pocheonensis]